MVADCFTYSSTFRKFLIPIFQILFICFLLQIYARVLSFMLVVSAINIGPMSSQLESDWVQNLSGRLGSRGTYS